MRNEKIYGVVVEGKGAPRKWHASYGCAMNEANRLFEKEHKRVIVVENVYSKSPEWYDSIPEGGLLCEVYDSIPDKRTATIISRGEDGCFHDDSGMAWCYAKPCTPKKLKTLLKNANEAESCNI